MHDLFPQRTIPISAAPPTDLQALIGSELVAISELLAPNTRRAAEARSRLRPLLGLDGSATGRLDQPTDREVARAERAIRAGQEWQTVFPGLAALRFAAPGTDAQEVSLRISKSTDAIPVRRASRDEPALAYARSNPFDEFGLKLSAFGERLGILRQEGYALIWHYKIKNDPLAYFIRRTGNGNVTFQGLSARALEIGRAALRDPNFDLATAVREYNGRPPDTR